MIYCSYYSSYLHILHKILTVNCVARIHKITGRSPIKMYFIQFPNYLLICLSFVKFVTDHI